MRFQRCMRCDIRLQTDQIEVKAEVEAGVIVAARFDEGVGHGVAVAVAAVVAGRDASVGDAVDRHFEIAEVEVLEL